MNAATAVSLGADREQPALQWLGADREGQLGVQLLELDHGLAARLSDRERRRISPLLRVSVEFLDAGPWIPGERHRDPSTLGLLVLDGMILRDVSVSGRCCAELLGPGDLLRPGFDPDDAAASVPAAPAWCVLDDRTRAAVIDPRAGRLLGRFPALMSELLDRSLIRARSLQFQLALTQVQGIGTRLELLFWHMADRWGRVTPDGVVLPMPLTHEMLGRLLGARRPSVSTALSALVDDGRIERCDVGWVLHGEPPASGDALRALAPPS